MDAEKFLEELVEGNLGDHIRKSIVQVMIDDLACEDEDREWAEGVADWLRGYL